MRPLEIGTGHATREDLETVRETGRAAITAVPGGSALLQPIALGSRDAVVVEVFVPEDEVSNGVATAWLVLVGVGVALIVGSVAVADRLGVRMVEPAQRLAGAAHDLGEGRLGTRVAEEGPAELRSAAAAFNSMADQVIQLLANERELAADLSHRLRTPLTVLRLNAASLGEGPAAEQTRAAVQQLEHEVDIIIRTAREQRPQSQGPNGAAGAGCDVSEVIRDRMAFWSALAEDEGREVRLAGVDRTVRIPVARPELVAALDALLGNVFRHTPEGTAFAVDVHHSGDAVIVLVSDAAWAGSPTRRRPWPGAAAAGAGREARRVRWGRPGSASTSSAGSRSPPAAMCGSGTRCSAARRCASGSASKGSGPNGTGTGTGWGGGGDAERRAGTRCSDSAPGRAEGLTSGEGFARLSYAASPDLRPGL